MALSTKKKEGGLADAIGDGCLWPSCRSTHRASSLSAAATCIFLTTPVFFADLCSRHQRICHWDPYVSLILLEKLARHSSPGRQHDVLLAHRNEVQAIGR